MFIKLAKIKTIFQKRFSKKELDLRKKIQLCLVVLVFLFWIFSANFDTVKNFSAKIISDNFSEEILEKEFLNLPQFLEKIKSWDENKVNDLKNIYEMDFINFWEILDEKVTQSWEKINFYFEATAWIWGSIHEFNYEWRIVEWEIIEIIENLEN